MGRPTRLGIVGAAFAGAAAVSCGASIQAVYEGDVRFEHCMALDARPDAKPSIRRACWVEWAEFYTFGQTRDRVDYARRREKQLSTANDFDEADWVQPHTDRGSAAPDPTSAAAPPPMIAATDGGAPATIAADAGTASSDCATSCREALDTCKHGCKGQACERGCAARHKACAKKCN